MLTDPPYELSQKDLEEALGKLRSREKQGRRLFAFYGSYPRTEELRISGGETCQVVPVRSELELREQLPPLGAHGKEIAFVIPWTGELPVDIAGRFSQNGRIKRIGKESRLKSILAASELGEGILTNPLADFLLANRGELLPDKNGARDVQPPAGGLVTREALFDRWLKTRFGIETQHGVALDLLLGWAAYDKRWKDADALESASPLLPAAIEAHLARSLGDAGVVVWKAWRGGRGAQLLELAVLFDALAHEEHGPAYTWRGLQQGELGVSEPAAVRGVALALGDAVGRALTWLRERDPELARTVLTRAEARVTAPDVRALLIESARLPLAWTQRLSVLGHALARGAEKPSGERLELATKARQHLELHASASDPKHDALLKRAGRALQLLAWLASGDIGPEPASDTPYRDAEALGRWYAEEGGFVDLARRGARGPADDEFGRGVRAVVEAADRVRRAQDQRFARSLAGWIEAGRPSAQCVPIDQAIDRVALKFLEGEKSRKLLVLLMDGMAWVQVVSILESLGEWTVPWGPIAWHGTSSGRIGKSALPVVFAQLPTVTEVSRAAFFAGKATPAGATQTTSDDPKRWLAHKGVSKVEKEGVDPRLLLRAEGHLSLGVASSEALSLVADPARRMVAMVINAIDASLKGDTQQRHEWTADSIGSFTQLLDAAREAGRAVLLAADHGHVPGELLISKGNYPDAKARYRPWASPSDPIGEGELGFSGAGVWAPKGAHGIIALVDEHARYGGGAHAGEHGGASLAEVVAPCLLIAPDDGRDVYDPEQKVMSALVPSWWHLELEPVLLESAAGETVQPRRIAKGRKAVPEGQLALGIATPTPPPPPAAAPKRRSSANVRIPSPLEVNELFRARCPDAALRKLVVSGVAYLVERHDAANLDAFCTALGEPTWRAAGLIRKIQSVLNVDGYDALTHDLHAKQVRLHRSVLETQFGVKL